MANVSNQDINEMAKLIKLISGNDDKVSIPRHQNSTQLDESYDQPPIYDTYHANQFNNYTVEHGTDLTEMAELFGIASQQAITEATNTVAYSKPTTQMSEIPRQMRMVFEIRSRLDESNGSSTKSYDIIETNSSKTVFNKLVLKEAAEGIMKYLNRGLATSDNRIDEIVSLEENYFRNRQDAIIFKKRHARCMELKEYEAAEIFEARYQVARANALVASDSIKNINKSIR